MLPTASLLPRNNILNQVVCILKIFDIILPQIHSKLSLCWFANSTLQHLNTIESQLVKVLLLYHNTSFLILVSFLPFNGKLFSETRAFLNKREQKKITVFDENSKTVGVKLLE